MNAPDCRDCHFMRHGPASGMPYCHEPAGKPVFADQYRTLGAPCGPAARKFYPLFAREEQEASMDGGGH